jgi:spermidine synthase
LIIAAYAMTILLFAFDFMDFHYLAIPLTRYERYGEQRIAVKEGVTETIQYLRKDLLQIPHTYRLLTNNHSMSGTGLNSRRYMSYFVHLPAAIHTNLKSALLICFGCGTTAKALTNTKSIEQIDVVDISEDIIEASQIVFPIPQENPIYDPRMNIHIEDGRFFLLNTEHQFDLITAEPPPPSHSGVENLYTQEYFQLIYNRLAAGGIVTYWLPVYQLSVAESKSILKGFCHVFETCTLWTGSNLEWMMMGVKDPPPPVTKEEFGRQWQDPFVRSELQAVGFENPEQFGAFFIADSQRLEEWLSDSLPLTDDYPQRLSSGAWNLPIHLDTYLNFMDATASQKNFLESEDIAQIWPEPLRQETIKYFPARQIINEILARPAWRSRQMIFYFHECLQNPLLNNYILWVLQSDHSAQQIVASVLQEAPEKVFQDPETYPHLAAGALQAHNYPLADRYLQLLTNLNTRTSRGESLSLEFYKMRMYLLYLSGDTQQAFELGQEYVQHRTPDKKRGLQEIEEYWNWLIDALGEKDLDNERQDFPDQEENSTAPEEQ